LELVLGGVGRHRDGRAKAQQAGHGRCRQAAPVV
jgi:hypothetical protein